jgi:hypothetical protein
MDCGSGLKLAQSRHTAALRMDVSAWPAAGPNIRAPAAEQHVQLLLHYVEKGATASASSLPAGRQPLGGEGGLARRGMQDNGNFIRRHY